MPAVNERSKAIFWTLTRRSAAYATRRHRLLALLTQAITKARGNRSVMREAWHDLSALIRMLRAWAKREYTQVPRKTVTAAIAAILYFVAPLDAVADFIPVAGFLDDFFILSWIFGTIHSDVEEFVRWENAHGQVIDAELERDPV